MPTDKQARVDALRRLTRDLYIVKGAWTQAQIAEFIGMSPGWVSSQLNGIKNTFPERLSEQMVMELDSAESSSENARIDEVENMIANLSGALMQIASALSDCASRVESVVRNTVGDADAEPKH